MTKVGEIPAYVLENAEKRLSVASRARRRQCATCPQPATHWPACGHASCETCRVVPPPPVPNPLMSEAHLRRTTGVMTTPGRTVFDNKAEASGQRVGSARRAAARGDA